MATKTMRTVRRVEKPRPLKTSEHFVKLQPVANEVTSPVTEKSPSIGDNILENLKCLHVSISNGNLNESTFVLIGHVCNQLKDAGSFLELAARDQLDKYFVTLRNASRDERIAMHIRMRLLEIIELRAMGWKTNNNISSYYEQRIVNAEHHSPTYIMTNVGVPNALMSSVSTSAIPTSLFNPAPQALMTSVSQASLGPGELIKNSGKFVKPTKIPGKNFYKDEILIRNSDSGKVSPGARDRLVQITGPHEDNISRAKGLIEDTIRRNASPIRDTPEFGGLTNLVTGGSSTSLNSSTSEDSLPNQPGSLPYQPPKHYTQTLPNSQFNPQQCLPSQAVQHAHQPNKKIPLLHSLSMGNNSLGEYSYTISVGPNAVRLSGSDAEFVKTAKLVLEEYFAGQAELSHNPSFSDIHTAFGSQRKPTKVQKQSTLDSENGSASLSNGHMGNSSSEEDTFKAEGSPPDRVLDLPLDSPQVQTSSAHPRLSSASEQCSTVKTDTTCQVVPTGNQGKSSVTVVRQPLFPASKPEEFKKAESSGDSAKKRREMFGRSSSQKDSSSSQEKSFEKRTSPDSKRTESNPHSFLLDCAKSQACRVLPEELKRVSPEVASIIVQENPLVYFDPATYKSQASTRKNTLRKSSSGGSEEVWEVE